MDFVSIIIPARNAGKTIEKCLDSILKLSYNEFEVIVVDDGSIDTTLELIKKFPKIKLIRLEGRGPGYARNIALKSARGTFIAFTDADCIVDKNWLIELMQCFTSEEIVGAGGSQYLPADDTSFAKLVALYMAIVGFTADYLKTEKGIVQTRHNPTCNVMYRRKFLEETGGFREDIWPGEDIELDFYRFKKLKLQYKFLYNPSAIVYHYRPANLKSFIKMMLRYGNALANLVKIHGINRWFDFFPFIILIVLIVFISGLIINLSNTLILFFSAVFFIYIILFLKNPKKSPALFFLFIINFIFWTYGFFIGILKSGSGISKIN